MLSCLQDLAPDSTGSWSQKTGQDGTRWEYKLGVSAERGVSIPLGSAHICLNLGLEAVGSEGLSIQ